MTARRSGLWKKPLHTPYKIYFSVKVRVWSLTQQLLSTIPPDRHYSYNRCTVSGIYLQRQKIPGNFLTCTGCAEFTSCADCLGPSGDPWYWYVIHSSEFSGNFLWVFTEISSYWNADEASCIPRVSTTSNIKIVKKYDFCPSISPLSTTTGPQDGGTTLSFLVNDWNDVSPVQNDFVCQFSFSDGSVINSTANVDFQGNFNCTSGWFFIFIYREK